MKFKGLITCLISLILTVMSCQIFAETVILKRMSIHELLHRWKFSFYLSGPINYRSFRLENPDRLVLDLKNVKTDKILKYDQLLGTPIKDIRYSNHADNIFRVVFDLDESVESTVQEVAGASPKERKLELIFSRKAHKIVGFGAEPISKAEKHRQSLLDDIPQSVMKKKRVNHVTL